MVKLIIIIFFISITSINISCESRTNIEQPLKGSDFLRVTEVVDGDTFWADNYTTNGIKIRLIGIDAPESRKVFKKEVGYYGKEAKEYLSKLLLGKKIKIICDVDSLDQYGRTLAYVYLENGTFINADLIKNGYAMVMTVHPNVKHVDEFLKFQQEAREYSRGLWGIKE